MLLFRFSWLDFKEILPFLPLLSTQNKTDVSIKLILTMLLVDGAQSSGCLVKTLQMQNKSLLMFQDKTG